MVSKGVCESTSPFWEDIQMIGLLLIIFFPQIVLWLPDVLFGKYIP